MALRLEFSEGMLNGTHIMVTDGCERETHYEGKNPEILLYCNVVVAMERFFDQDDSMSLHCDVCHSKYTITREEFDAHMEKYRITLR